MSFSFAGCGQWFKPTDDIFQTCVSRDSLSVIAFPSFKTLGYVHHGLDCFPLEVKLVNATLSYHLTWKVPFSRTKRGEGEDTHSV